MPLANSSRLTILLSGLYLSLSAPRLLLTLCCQESEPVRARAVGMQHDRLVSECAISRDLCVLINWRVMLLSDGSVTRHLKLLIDGSQIKVRNTKTRDIQVQSPTRRDGRKVGSARRVDDHSSNCRAGGVVQPGAVDVAAAALPHDVVNLIAVGHGGLIICSPRHRVTFNSQETRGL